MCENCGCSDIARPAVAAGHEHGHAGHGESAGLAHNDRLAERNRGYFLAKRVFVVNLLSFSTSGAAALVDRTLAEFGQRRQVARINAAWLESIQASHVHARGHAEDPAAGGDENATLDAHAIGHALAHVNLDQADVLLIENSGNATSQALNDLGETVRVAVISVRDGALKPLKFPLFFGNAAAVVIHEIDQAAAAGFDIAQARESVRQVSPAAAVLEASVQTGAGLEDWYAFLEEGVQRAKRKH